MRRQSIGFVLGFVLFALCLVLPSPEGLSVIGMKVAAVAILMAVWWMSEAVPIPVTALIPIVLFPLLGVMPTQQVTASYANHMVYLFMGGFLIAVCMEKWRLHKRIALHTIRLVGSAPTRIILGFMLATAFLSMWISNTATAMMMVTIGLAVIKQIQEENPGDHQHFATSLMLGIAYAASIGGVATLIGTPPNAILAGVLEKNFGMSIGFLDWMLFALPLSAIMLLLAWLYLTRIIYQQNAAAFTVGSNMITAQLHKLGPISRQEKRVLLVFCSVALAWVVRGLIDVPGLSMVTDSSIAMLGALALFVIPADFSKREFLLDWKTAQTIPWDIIILFGGGFALAAGFSHSGLTQWLAGQLGGLQGMDFFMLLMMIVLLVIFLTEVTSNTATASLLLPVMGALALGMDAHPLLTMAATALAASFAFMLPVATPPNAIIFASRVVTIPQMAKAGLMLNLVGAVLIAVLVYFLLPVLIDSGLV